MILSYIDSVHCPGKTNDELNDWFVMNEINDDNDSILMYCKLNFICQFLLKVHCMQGLADIIDSINTFMYLFCAVLLLKLR